MECQLTSDGESSMGLGEAEMEQMVLELKEW